MRLSRAFIPTLKENPVDAKIVSHRLMLRAGLIRQHAAGIYNWLPIGTEVLKNAKILRHCQLQQAGLTTSASCTPKMKTWLRPC